MRSIHLLADGFDRCELHLPDRGFIHDRRSVIIESLILRKVPTGYEFDTEVAEEVASTRVSSVRIFRSLYVNEFLFR